MYEFLKQNDIKDDYHRGIFLHLLTDYLFFNYFISKDYLKNTSYERFCKDLYYSYDIIDNYLFDKYKIDYPVFKEEILKAIDASHAEKNVDSSVYLNLLPVHKLDKFIEDVGSINLENYVIKLKKAGKNVLPDELEEEK